MQKKFCDEYIINGRLAVDARIVAGYSSKCNRKTHIEAACRMLKLPLIAAYISDATERGLKKAGITIESIGKQLIEDRAFAYKTGKPASAVAATMAMARLHGLIIDQREVKVDVNSKVERIERVIIETGTTIEHDEQLKIIE